MVAAIDLNPFDLLSQVLSWSLEHLHLAFNHVALLRSIGSFGLAVISLTLIIRTLLFPLFAWQLRTMKKTQGDSAKIQPELMALRKKYKGQPQKLQQATQQLYRDHNVNPAGMMLGCIPTLIQAVLIYPFYFAIRDASTRLHSDLGFLWIPNVTQTSHQACCLVNTDPNGVQHFTGWITGMTAHPVFLIIPLLAGVATFVQSRMMLVPIAPGTPAQAQSMQNMGKQMTFLAPVMIVVMGVNFAQGIALYWITQSAYMIVQQFYLLVVKDYHSLGGTAVPHPEWVVSARRLLGRETGAGVSARRPVAVAASGFAASDTKPSSATGTHGGSAAPNQSTKETRHKRR